MNTLSTYNKKIVNNSIANLAVIWTFRAILLLANGTHILWNSSAGDSVILRLFVVMFFCRDPHILMITNQ